MICFLALLFLAIVGRCRLHGMAPDRNSANKNSSLIKYVALSYIDVLQSSQYDIFWLVKVLECTSSTIVDCLLVFFF